MCRVSRRHRQPHEAEAAQQVADWPLGQRHVEAGLNHSGEISLSPTHCAAHGRVRAGPNQFSDDRRLLGAQARPRANRAALVRQSRQAFVVLAVHPVTQRLPIHAGRARRIGLRQAIELQRERQHPTRCIGVPTRRLCSPKTSGVVVVAGDRDCR